MLALLTVHHWFDIAKPPFQPWISFRINPVCITASAHKVSHELGKIWTHDWPKLWRYVKKNPEHSGILKPSHLANWRSRRSFFFGNKFAIVTPYDFICSIRHNIARSPKHRESVLLASPCRVTTACAQTLIPWTLHYPSPCILNPIDFIG